MAAETDFAEERFQPGAEVRIRRPAISDREAEIETLRVTSSTGGTADRSSYYHFSCIVVRT